MGIKLVRGWCCWVEGEGWIWPHTSHPQLWPGRGGWSNPFEVQKPCKGGEAGGVREGSAGLRPTSFPPRSPLRRTGHPPPPQRWGAPLKTRVQKSSRTSTVLAGPAREPLFLYYDFYQWRYPELDVPGKLPVKNSFPIFWSKSPVFTPVFAPPPSKTMWTVAWNPADDVQCILCRP